MKAQISLRICAVCSGLHCLLTESLDTAGRMNGEQNPGWYFADVQDDLNLCKMCMFEGTFLLDLSHMFFIFTIWYITLNVSSQWNQDYNFHSFIYSVLIWSEKKKAKLEYMVYMLITLNITITCLFKLCLFTGSHTWSQISFRGDNPSHLEGHTLVSYKVSTCTMHT